MSNIAVAEKKLGAGPVVTALQSSHDGATASPLVANSQEPDLLPNLKPDDGCEK